jgi:hypothetical protein
MQNIFICPYLENSDDAVCEAAISMVKNNHINEMEGININKICLSRRFESCYFYFAALKRKADVCSALIFPIDTLTEDRKHIADMA